MIRGETEEEEKRARGGRGGGEADGEELVFSGVQPLRFFRLIY